MSTNKKSKKVSSVKSLDNLLVFILFILIIGIGVGIYFAYTNLSSTAQEANKAISKLQQENAPVQNIDSIEAHNKQYADILQIAPQLSIPQSDIQSTATSDINKYARITGLQISSTTYGNSSSTAPQSNAPSGGQMPNNNSNSSNNTIKLEFKNTAPMKSILQFIKLVENNIPIMYVTDISLEGTEGKNVKLNSITIGVSVR